MLYVNNEQNTKIQHAILWIMIGGFCATLSIFAASFRSSFSNLLRAFQDCVYVLRRISVHEVHPSTFSVNGLSYYDRSEAGEKIFRLASVKLSLHFPTPNNPYFITICAKGLRHFGPLGSGCCNAVLLRIRLPRRDQAWFRVRIDHIQATVRGSISPYAIDRLRENILRTIILGRIVRLDDFTLTADTAALWSGKSVSAVVEASGYEVTVADRTYDFAKLRAILARNWDNKHGRFLFIMDGLTWSKTNVDETGGSSGLCLLDFLCYPATIIASIAAAIPKPGSLFDLELIHGEVKFPRFRHRDQPFLKHTLQFTGESNPQIMQAGFTERFMWSTIGEILDAINAHPDSDSDSDSESDPRESESQSESSTLDGVSSLSSN